MSPLCLAVVALLVTTCAPLPAEDAARFSRSGVSFDHPKDWKVSAGTSFGLTTITIRHPGGAHVTLQLHPPGSNPVGVRIQQERALQQANQGKLIESVDPLAKRAFSVGIQEGTTLLFKGEDGKIKHYEVYAFVLQGKKRALCSVIFLHPAKDAEIAEGAFALLAETLTEEGAPRPAAKAAPQPPAVQLRVPVPKGWQLLPARKGVKLWEDQYLEFTLLPRELEGGQLVLRNVDQAKAWLAPERITVVRDCTVYAIVRTKYLGAVTVNSSVLRQLGRDGWLENQEPVKSSFPPGEDWGWRVLRRSLKKGDDFPELQGLILGQPVVFVFK